MIIKEKILETNLFELNIDSAKREFSNVIYSINFRVTFRNNGLKVK